MGKETKDCQACKQLFAGMAYFIGRLRAYKVSSLISSIVTSGFVFKVLDAEELLKHAATANNRCLGTTLELVTQFLLLGESAAGRMLLAFVFSASLAGVYLSKHEWTEAQDLGAAIIASIVFIVVAVALHIGTANAIWTCMP